MIYGEKPWLKFYHNIIAEFPTIENLSLTELFEQSVKDHAFKTAITFYDKTWSYKDVYTISEQLAAAIHSLQFKKGDRLAVMLPNTPHYLFSLFSTLRLGGIGVQVNPMYVEREIEHILNDSGAEYMVVHDKLYERVKQVQSQTKLKHIIVVSLDGEKIELADGDFHFDECIDREAPLPPRVNINPDEDVAILQYTGGTTGVSKGVMLTHRNLIANTEQLHDFMFKTVDKPDNPKIMGVLPMFHIYGLTFNVFLGLKAGCNIVILPRFNVQEVLETVKREKPFQFSGVPTMYIALNSHPELEKYGFDEVPYYFSGGSSMPVEQLNLFEKRTGCIFCEGYGLSETSPTTHYNPPFQERRAGSIGIPVPGLEAKVVQVKEEGYVEVPIGEVGELIVKGPQVMKGYWNRQEDTNEVIKDGWLFTGDMARMDKDGYFYIVDRKKDLIIASGYNIYPREIEEVLYHHHAIQEVAVVGVPDSYRGETVKAFVKLKDGETTTAEDIMLYAKQNLAAYKVPKLLEFREELPKSAVGKLLKRKLRDKELQTAHA